MKDRIEKGREWYQGLLNKGYEETPDGLLPLSEIKKAGYVQIEGQWIIPSEIYIADGNSDRPVGQKYVGIAKIYLNWRKDKKKSTVVTKISKFNFTKKEIDIENYTPPDSGIDVNSIPF